MYRKSNHPELTPQNFKLPVAVELLPDNRWVIMAELIPWGELARSLAEGLTPGVSPGACTPRPDGGAGGEGGFMNCIVCISS